MTHQILMLGDAVQKEIDAVVAFASRPENLYTETGDKAPEEHEEHCLVLFPNVLCTYAHLALDDQRFRHLSITVMGRPPGLTWVVMIAKAFGFTGYEPERDPSMLPPWQIRTCSDGCCAVVVQPLEA